MKRSEIYSELRTIEPCFVRLDGRNFKRTLDRLGFEKPYDVRLRDGFVNAALRCFTQSGFNPVFVYMFSDEMSILFQELPFDGRVEKIDSVLASFFASALTIELGVDTPIAFDSRIVPMHPDDIVDYLQWRQAESFRNCLNSYVYHTLRKCAVKCADTDEGDMDSSAGSNNSNSSGMDGREAARIMKGMKAPDMHELLFNHGININDVDAWQRRGVLVYSEEETKEGINPVTGEHSVTSRRRIVTNMDIPLFSSNEGKALVELLCRK